MSRVLVDFNSPSKEIRIPELLMSGKQHRAAGGYPKPEAVVVTGSAAAPTAGARVGDVLIGPCSELPISPDASSSNYVLRRAVDVLRGEVGEDGYWLISSSGDQGSIAAINTKGLTKDTPRLHYIRDIEELIRIPSRRSIGSTLVAHSATHTLHKLMHFRNWRVGHHYALHYYSWY